MYTKPSSGTSNVHERIVWNDAEVVVHEPSLAAPHATKRHPVADVACVEMSSVVGPS